MDIVNEYDQISFISYVIDRRSYPDKIKNIISRLDRCSFLCVEEPKYEVWDHVKKLGIRLSVTATYNIKNISKVLKYCNDILNDYKMDDELEVSADFGFVTLDDDIEYLYITTLWKDRRKK